MVESPPSRLLVVLHNPDERLRLQQLLPQAGFRHLVRFAGDGQEAMEYLLAAPSAGAETHPIPQVLLLELCLLRMDGLGVLSWLRQRSPLPHLPAVVLTASKEQKEIDRAYASGANSCVVKPDNSEGMLTLLGLLAEFWGEWNHAPGH